MARHGIIVKLKISLATGKDTLSPHPGPPCGRRPDPRLDLPDAGGAAVLRVAGGREDPQGEVPGEDEGGEGRAALGVAGARRLQLHPLRV